MEIYEKQEKTHKQKHIITEITFKYRTKLYNLNRYRELINTSFLNRYTCIKRVVEGSFMMLFIESSVLWVATFAVGISLFYLAAKFEAHEKTDVNAGKHH